MKWSNEVKALSTTYGVFKAYDNHTRHSSEYYDLNIKYPVWKKNHKLSTISISQDRFKRLSIFISK